MKYQFKCIPNCCFLKTAGTAEDVGTAELLVSALKKVGEITNYQHKRV